MTEKVAVITGASAGIGKAAARALLDRGWRVIGTGRDPARCVAAEAELDHPAFTMLRGDMALLGETGRIADEIEALTEAGAITGQYYDKGVAAEPSPAARGDASAARLWDVSETLVAGF